MTLAPEVQTRGLGLVRYLYDLALHQSRQSGLRRATAILTFHDAVEMFLVLGLQHHDVYNAKRLYRFEDYWTELARVGVQVTQKGTMESLSRVRANFKHHAITPSPSALEDARVHVRDFFTENLPNVFGLNFEDLSLASAVPFERSRLHLEKAEKLMAEAKCDDALGDIAFAFELLIDDYEASRLRGRSKVSPDRFSDVPLWDLGNLDLTNRGGPSLPREIARRLDDFGRNIRQKIASIEKALELVSLGIDYERYVRFIGLTPTIVKHGPDPAAWGRSEWHDERPPTIDECRFCFDFVIESALRLQELVSEG